MSKYNYNESYFKNIHTENQAYWLGFLYIWKRKYRVI